MAQLRTLDAAIFKAQDPVQHASLALGALAVLDGPAPDHDLFATLLTERIGSIPRCAQLPRTHSGFDLGRHAHRMTLAGPGDDGDLFRGVAQVLRGPLDLSRPPWECWIIEGLKDNNWAILMKIHQCMAGGISAAHLLSRICDDADADMFTNSVDTKSIPPSHREAPGWVSVGRQALWQASTVTGTITSALAGALWPAARTAPSGPAPTRRRYRTVRVPISAVDAVCAKFGVGADDVALAAITEGFRTVLLRRGEQPRADSLRTVVAPQHFSAHPHCLPVEHSDPVARLKSVYTRRNAPPDPGRQADILGSAINCLPVMLRGNVIQWINQLSQHVVTLTTHANGPRNRLRLMGHRVECLLPIPPTAAQLSTGVAVLSYGDELVVGITAEDHAALDITELASGIELGMARLVALSEDSVLLFSKDRRRRRAQRPSPSGPDRGRPSPPARARH